MVHELLTSWTEASLQHNFKIMILKTTLHLVFCLLFSVAFSQVENTKKHTLDDCIKIALENNLTLQSATLQTAAANTNYFQSKMALLPSLNGNYNLGVNNGRSIDPFTNDFIDQELTFSNAQLRLDATIFNGFRLLNTLYQNKFNKKATEMEALAAKQDLTLNVTLAYLQALNARDVLQLTKERLVATNQQLERLATLYKQEVGNPADFTDIQGQKSIDETAVITAKNALKNALLNLSNLLNSPTLITIQNIEALVDFKDYKKSSEEVFQNAAQNLAAIKAATLRIKAAEKGVNVAKALYTPEVSVFGQLGTNYSSAAQLFTENGTQLKETGGFVSLNNQEIPVLTNETQFEGNSITYGDQFDNNLNSVIGVAVNIPLFNGFRAKNTVALEKVKVASAVVELHQTKQELRQAIQQAYFDMQAAMDRYQSLEKQVAAFSESYRINEIRFSNGVSNYVAYITSKNNLENAQTNLANAKYSYMLRIKILDFYSGS